jgi:hypothetical protein
MLTLVEPRNLRNAEFLIKTQIHLKVLQIFFQFLSFSYFEFRVSNVIIYTYFILVENTSHQSA